MVRHGFDTGIHLLQAWVGLADYVYSQRPSAASILFRNACRRSLKRANRLCGQHWHLRWQRPLRHNKNRLRVTFHTIVVSMDTLNRVFCEVRPSIWRTTNLFCMSISRGRRASRSPGSTVSSAFKGYACDRIARAKAASTERAIWPILAWRPQALT